MLQKGSTPPNVVIAIIGVLGLALNIWIAVQNKTGLGVDFNQFYSAGRLAGTGHLYDWEALRKVEAENGFEVPTGRLPVVLFGYKILSGMPYAVARAIWMGLGILLLILFACTWPGARPPVMLAALAWSLPATFVILFGQDVPVWLMAFTAALLMIDRKRPWLAGILFSLCICKFHLALGIPVLLAAQKRWSTMVAGAISVAVWIAGSFWIEGPGWPAAYQKFSAMPAFSPAAERMPNLYGVASWLPWTSAIEVVTALAVVGLLWTVCRDNQDLGMAGAAAAACGLLLSHHSYAGDCTLLIPLSVLTLQRQGLPSWLKAWAVLMLTPAVVLMIVSNKPYFGQVLIVAFVVTAVWVGRARALGAEAQAA